MDRTSSSPSNELPLPRWRTIAAVWLLVGAFRYSEVYLRVWAGLAPFAWNDAWAPLAWAGLLRSAVWTLYTPLVLRLARRFPVMGEGWPRRLGVHAAAALGLAAAGIPLYWLLSRATYPPGGGDYSFLPYFFQNLGSELVLYAAVAGVAHAMEHHRRAREREAGAARLEALVRDAQLGAMRVRLDTGLVDGALGAFIRLARRSPEEAEELVAALGDVVRGRMAAADEPVCALGEEIEAARTWFEVRRALSDPAPELEVDAPDELLGEPVPSGALQALLEHALGSSGSGSARSLTLTVSMGDGGLVAEVRAAGLPHGSAPSSAASVAGGREGPLRPSPISGGFRLALSPVATT